MCGAATWARFTEGASKVGNPSDPAHLVTYTHPTHLEHGKSQPQNDGQELAHFLRSWMGAGCKATPL